MGTSTLFYPHAIALPGPAIITQISDVVPSHNFMDITELAAGQVGPQFTGTAMAAPDNRFTTPQLKTILDLCTDFGVAKDLSAGNVDVEYRSGLNLGTRVSAAGLSHIRARAANNTMLCWESFVARQGQLVQMKCRLAHVMNVSTGADPLVFTNGLALAVTSSFGNLYTLGPQKVNGTFLTGVTEVSWENGIIYDEVASDGDGFLTFAGVKHTIPRLTITTTDMSLMNTFGTRGTALTALSCFLTKKLKSGINVAPGTAQHIALTSTLGTIKAREVAGGDGAAAVQISIQLEEAATDTACFAINTAIAIS